MKNYTIIDKEISKYKTGKNKNLDIYLYCYINLCSNFNTKISHATQQKIQKLTGIKLRTLQSSISRLRETNLIDIETISFEGKRHNTYYFNRNPKNFFFVDNSFFHVDIDIKLKGLLLLIKSICLNNSNVTLYNRTKIAELLSQDRNTVSKMIDELIEKDMLIEVNGFVLPANYFQIYSKDKQSKYNYEKVTSFDEFALKSILDFCKTKHTILFTPDLTPLKWIFAKYPFLIKDIDGLDAETIETCYLPKILEKRCETLPQKIESLNYFLTVLNIQYIEQKKSDDNLVYL